MDRIGINSDDRAISPIVLGSSESPDIDLSFSFSISLVITDFRESLQQLIAIKQEKGAEAEEYKQISDALQNRLSQQESLPDPNIQIPLDLYSKNEDGPTILNLVLETEDEALFQAIIQYAKEDNRLDNLLDSTLSYAQNNQQYRSLCWFAAQKNSPLFPDAVDECFVIPEEWLEGANASLLGGIFKNYKKKFDAYNTHCDTFKKRLDDFKKSTSDNQEAIATSTQIKTELEGYVEKVMPIISSIVEKLLNQARKIDDPTLLLEIANFYLNWSEDSDYIKNKLFSAKKLAEIGPNTLAHLISNDGFCDPHDLRQELNNRYVRDPDQAEPFMKSDNPVRRALQEKYDFYQKANRVADFYKNASLHVIEKIQSASDENKKIYKHKLKAISKQIADTSNDNSLPDLSAQAGKVADELLSDTDIQKTTGFFRPCCGFNKTQTKINNRQKALGWGPQKKELNKSTSKIPDYLRTDTLYQIPLSKKEQDACVKRAVEARAVFKETLDYLSNRYGDKDVKLTLLEEHIQHYIRGYDNDGNEYSWTTFSDKLKRNTAFQTHRYSYSWRSFFGFQTTTAEKLREAIDMLRSLK